MLRLHCTALQFRLEELRILLPIAFSNPILRAVGFLTALSVRKEGHEAQTNWSGSDFLDFLFASTKDAFQVRLLFPSELSCLRNRETEL